MDVDNIDISIDISNNIIINNLNKDKDLQISSLSLNLLTGNETILLKTLSTNYGFNSNNNTKYIPSNGIHEGNIIKGGKFIKYNLFKILKPLNNSQPKHGSFVQNDSSDQSVQSALGTKGSCCHPCSHQTNILSNGEWVYNIVSEGEFQRPDIYTQQNIKTAPSQYSDYDSKYTQYPEQISSTEKSYNVGWINSAYNIFNFTKEAIESHNNLNKPSDSNKVKYIVAKTTSYRNINTSRFSDNTNDIQSTSKLPRPTNNKSAWPNSDQENLDIYIKRMINNVPTAIKSNTNNSGCGGINQTGGNIETSWINSIFYIGDDLPSLPEYAAIEKLYGDTDYGGRYIQLQWQPSVQHPSRSIEFYITRNNLYDIMNTKKQNGDTAINISGNDMNGLASFCDVNANDSSNPTLGFNIPLFQIHRALSMGPKGKTAIGDKIAQNPKALYDLAKQNNIFHLLFMWSVTDAAFWQQPFNIIFTNQVNWSTYLPPIIMINPLKNTVKQPTKLLTDTKHKFRLYQWGHYTLKLTGWKYPPSGFTNTNTSTDNNSINPTNGGKSNEVSDTAKDDFNFMYNVTDCWGTWSNNKSANFFKTLNGGGAPSPTPTSDCSNSNYMSCPTCPPSTPSPNPPPVPTKLKCPLPEPPKTSLGWAQAKFDSSKKQYIGPGGNIDVYNCKQQEQNTGIKCGTGCGNFNAGESAPNFWVPEELGKYGVCDSQDLGGQAVCMYKPGCYYDSKTGKCSVCKIDEADGGCKISPPTTSIEEESKCSCPVCPTPSPSPTPKPTPGPTSGPTPTPTPSPPSKDCSDICKLCGSEPCTTCCAKANNVCYPSYNTPEKCTQYMNDSGCWCGTSEKNMLHIEENSNTITLNFDKDILNDNIYLNKLTNTISYIKIIDSKSIFLNKSQAKLILIGNKTNSFDIEYKDATEMILKLHNPISLNNIPNTYSIIGYIYNKYIINHIFKIVLY